MSEQPAGTAAGLLRSSATLAELGLADDLVTGEAVVLDLRPASFATRALALLLDLLVVALAGVLVTWLLVTVLSVDATPPRPARSGWWRRSGC